MDPQQRIIELLEEIRDLDKAWIEESRARIVESIELQQKAVRRQLLAMRIGALILIPALGYLVVAGFLL